MAKSNRGRNYSKSSNKSDNIKGNSNSGSSKGVQTNSLEAMLNKHPELTQSTSTISWNVATGTRFPINSARSQITGAGRALPGMMVFKFIPTYGVSKSADSALNTASLALYGAVRKKISGARNYDHTNLFMYYMAVDSLFTMWANCQRAMQLVNNFNVENRYWAKPLVEALGFDYEDLANNQANFRAWMDTYALQTNVFAIPRDSAIFGRHVTLVSDVYVDAVSDKAQIYAFKLDGYYKYDETSDPGKTKLTYKHLPAKLTADGASKIIKEMVQALANSSDVALYAGDIRTAFEGELWVMGGYNDIVLEAKYDPDMLKAIHNMDIQYMAWGNMDVTEALNANNDPYLIIEPTCSVMYGYDEKIILDTTPDKMDPLSVLNMTRFKAQPSSWTLMPSGQDTQLTSCKFDALGTEVIGEVAIYTTTLTDTGEFNIQKEILPAFKYFLTDRTKTLTFATAADAADFFNFVSDITKFTDAPILKMWNFQQISGKDPVYNLWNAIGTMDTVAVIDKSMLANMHEAALISLLGL